MIRTCDRTTKYHQMMLITCMLYLNITLLRFNSFFSTFLGRSTTSFVVIIHVPYTLTKATYNNFHLFSSISIPLYFSTNHSFFFNVVIFLTAVTATVFSLLITRSNHLSSYPRDRCNYYLHVRSLFYLINCHFFHPSKCSLPHTYSAAVLFPWQPFNCTPNRVLHNTVGCLTTRLFE